MNDSECEIVSWPLPVSAGRGGAKPSRPGHAISDPLRPRVVDRGVTFLASPLWFACDIRPAFQNERRQAVVDTRVHKGTSAIKRLCEARRQRRRWLRRRLAALFLVVHGDS
ncbi:hypothetical protein E2C01_095060 [Portunus trituberculatus]|uniref:Uncharacterized protein n=1 Tax=Portunus trituberculatus TaxID=210409 RepID=A0A5B7JZ05_PORTR|nr:hypothetical protein [Portunus trituberculatus]